MLQLLEDVVRPRGRVIHVRLRGVPAAGELGHDGTTGLLDSRAPGGVVDD
jgi:hypothetical protein